jgi:hypothetical protein
LKDFNTWKFLKVCHKECVQGFSERLEVVRKSRRIWTFKGVEGRQEAKHLESLKEGIVKRTAGGRVPQRETPRLVCAEVLRGRTDGQNSLRRNHEVP